MSNGVRFITPMDVNSLFSLRKERKISWRTFGVGVALASFANSKGICWPSRRAIGERTTLHPSAVSESIRELETLGWVKRHLKNGKISEYQIIEPLPKSSNTQTESYPKQVIPKSGKGCYPKQVRGITRKGSDQQRNILSNKRKNQYIEAAQKIIDLWNLNMGAKISPAKGHLKNIEKCICAVPDFLEKYEKAAPKFKGVDDSGWPQGKVSFPWSLVLNKPDGLFYPVVDRVLDGVYDKKEKKTKTSFEERYKRATEMKDWKDG